MVLGVDEFSMEKWRAVDKQLNKYPGHRTFTAIGRDSQDEGLNFKASMIKAVESVLGQPVLPTQVEEKPSSKGSYISVRIGVVVNSPDQVG
jgi:putative lipoic acid-binding regulatory protein